MKLSSHILVIVFIIALYFTGRSENWINCARKEPVKIKNPIELKVKLSKSINITNLPNGCGFMMVCENFNFKVQEVISGIYKDSTIIINIVCPRESIVNNNFPNFDSIYDLKVIKLGKYKINGTEGKRKQKKVSVFEIID